MEADHHPGHRWVRHALVLWAGFGLLYLAGWAWVWRSGPKAAAVGDVVPLVAAAVGAVLTARTSRRLSGRARRAWQLFTLGLVLWALAEALYTLSDLVLWRGDLPFPGPADPVYLAGYAVLAAALLTLPSAPVRRASRVRWALDGVLLTGALLMVSWSVVLGPAVRSTTMGTGWALAVGLAYPVGDLVLVVLAVSCLRRARLGGRRAIRLVVAAVLIEAASDSAYLVLLLHGTYSDGTPLDLGWALSYLLLGIAALCYHPEADAELETPLRGLALAGPYLAFAVAVPFLGWQYWRTGRLDAVPAGTAALCVVAVCLRQWLSSRDNAELATALSTRQAQLRRLAYYDPLTDLPNRTLLHDRLSHALAGRSPRLAAVLLIDLDGFKAVNDTYGHEAGDELLVAVARRLRDCVRPGDTVARLGGDEFAVVLEEAPQTPPRTDPRAEGSGPTTPFAVAERACLELSGAYDCTFATTFVTASVGVAVPDSLSTAPDLLRNADLAMYQAKTHGGNRAWVYEPALHDAVTARHALQTDLHLAFLRGELRVVYQPVVALPDGRPVGVEALARWDHPQRGTVTPADFVPIAEASGLLGEIDAWVMAEAGRQVVDWRAAGFDLALSVNMAAQEVQSGTVATTVAGVLALTGLPAAALTLEVTENVLVEDIARAVTVLERLRGLGVRVALDDFGTGYCSLAYLARLPVDCIKIDRSFVRSIDAERRPGVLVEAMIWIGQRLGLDVVAEGVETEQQVRELAAMRCDLAQGFYYAAPMAAAEVGAYLRRARSAPVDVPAPAP